MSQRTGANLVLGIESTAHTFSASVVRERGSNTGEILSDVRSVYESPLGTGIHPREASRHHVEHAPRILRDALIEAGVRIQDLTALAFSAGPGLGPCLRVGAVVARTLAKHFVKPLVPVNHAIGHIELGSLLTGVEDPLVLLVSGGHTLTSVFDSGRWRIFGETLDITVGQLVDQFGREAGFGSPCGPIVERLAEKSSAYVPLPYTVKGNDLSLSGILTAAKRLLHNNGKLEDLASSIQETCFAMLAEIVERGLAFSGKSEVLLAGGVAANRRLQDTVGEMCGARGARLATVPSKYTGDCGSQIAWTGLLAHRAGIDVSIDDSAISQSWRIDQVDAKWRS